MQLEESLDRNEYINTDFEPRLMNIVFQEWFAKHGASPKYFFLILLVLTVTYFIFMRREEYVLFSTGLATMGVEMLIVFTFQVIYGYIYLKIGAIVTAFLLGLLPGAMVANLLGRKDVFKLVVSEMLILSLLLLFFVWVTYFKSELHPFYFLIYCFFFSFLCGFQFPVAAHLIGEKSSPAASCLAADLSGASVGTIATGTILIPLWGIQFAVIFLILVKISSSMIIMFTGRTRV
jgi:spermidine synthase